MFSLSSVASSDLQDFSTLSHKRHDFRKKTLNIKCVFWFSLQICLKYFSYKEELSDTLLKMYISLFIKYPLFLSYFSKTWTVSTDLRRKSKFKISYKSIQWQPNCFVRSDRQTLRSQQPLLPVLRTRLKKPQGLKICSFSVATKQAVLPATEIRAIQQVGIMKQTRRDTYTAAYIFTHISLL